MGLFGDFFSSVQKGTNATVGKNYRDIYFKNHPGQYHTCKGCGMTLDSEVRGEVTIDHIIPQKCYGTNAITNLQVLCRSCNSRKKDKVNELALKYSGQALAREIQASLGF